MVAINGTRMHDRVVGILHVPYHKMCIFDIGVDYKLLY
jgi:hypothetical protein